MNTFKVQQGFSIVELMVATLLGLIVCYSILEIYLAQSRLYKTSNSQDVILNTENAISYLVTPFIRSAGFLGCSGFTTAVSNLNAGGPNPLGTFSTTPTLVYGYNGSGATYTIPGNNPANSTTASDWTPALFASLLGRVQRGNDVVTVFGAHPNSFPIGVTQVDASSNFFTVQSTTGSSAASGQYGAISDCVKTVVFYISSLTGTTVTHAAGAGTLQNADSQFPVTFQVGSQFIPLQQTAFFVGQGQGGQSSLMRAVLNGSTWTVEPIIPGIEFMKVQYGIGTNGIVTQYVSANAVIDWSQIYAIRIAFLIVGRDGSGSAGGTTFQVLDTTVTVPADNRLRHVFELTIQLRNAIS